MKSFLGTHTPPVSCSNTVNAGTGKRASKPASPVYARSRPSGGMSWATVTCGWYGKRVSRASGPERTAASSRSHWAMPAATTTNTTSETGRKVPVPDRCISNGGYPAAVSAR